VSEEYDSMRVSLLNCMLQLLSRNKLHEYPQAVFEIGRVFVPAPEHVDEAEHVCIALAGETDYTRIRQHADALLAAFGLIGTYAAVDDARFLKGRVAQLSVDGAVLGVVGEIAPRVLSHAQLTVPVALAELDVDVLRLLVMKKLSD
jgi:phenylalanyl-tRNA synthetase beta chain